MILIEVVFPELSSTMNVGLNVAPLKITKRLSCAVVVKFATLSPILIFTVGLTSSIFTLTFIVLDFVFCAAKGPFGLVAGNVTLTSRSTSSPPRPVTVSPDTHS